jgi:anti-sigma factor RsiW
VKCEDAQGLLGGFFDGELPGDAMRDVARHLASCSSCEAVTTKFEDVRKALRQAIETTMGQPDMETAWRSIAPRLGVPRRRLRERLSTFIEQLSFGGVPAPVVLGAATAAAVAIVLWATNGSIPGDTTEHQQIAQTRIDSLDAPGSVSVWNQPDNGALVIWVDSDGMNVETLGP